MMISKGVPFDQITLLTLHIQKSQAWENSVDPGHTPQNVASDQGLAGFPLVQELDTHS